MRCSFRSFRVSARRGFTLVEVVICLLIVMLAGLGTVGAITYSRLNMELEKQRLAALNYCRQAMEAVQSLRSVHSGEAVLVPFNTPVDSPEKDLKANLVVKYYRLTEAGAVDWANEVVTPSNEEPIFAQVKVTWTPYGSNARPQEVAMSTILTMGIN